MDIKLIISLVGVGIGLVLNIVALVIPYWVTVGPLHIGLWKGCADGVCYDAQDPGKLSVFI